MNTVNGDEGVLKARTLPPYLYWFLRYKKVTKGHLGHWVSPNQDFESKQSKASDYGRFVPNLPKAGDHIGPNFWWNAPEINEYSCTAPKMKQIGHVDA